MTDPVSPRRIAINGTTYELRRWAWSDGKPWSDRLGLIAARAAVGAKTDEDRALGKFLDLVDESVLDGFWRTCVKYTDLVGMGEGRERVVSLADCEEAHMIGRYSDYLRLRVEHLRVEFGPFFADLRTSAREVFGAGPAT